MMKIVELGVRDHYPLFLKKKIQLSNQIALLLLPLCIPYVAFSIFFFPGIAIFPEVVMVSSMMVFVLNYLGLHVVSRFLVSTVVNVSILGYQVYLIQANEPLIISLYVIHLSLLVIPLLVFDVREKGMLIGTTLICVLCFLSVGRLSGYFEHHYDTTMFRTGFLGEMGVVIGVLILMVSLSVLLRTNFASEVVNETLVAEMEKHNQELTASQDKLKDYISKLKESQEDERRRNWASEGVALFADLLRMYNDDIAKLTEVVIAKLAHYMELNQAGIFILNEDDATNPYLELLACFAYDRKKFIEKRIKPGEGLAGQVFLDKKVSILKKVPDGYLYINSGLGKSTAGCVVIVPLILNEKAYGVVELASFREIESYQIEFVKKLGENIASTLVNVRNNQLTRRLLDEAQLRTEELRQKEEEMRQNMEELTATQEEMQRQIKAAGKS